MLIADGADRAANQHRRVGGFDGRLGRHGELELPGTGLGMELLDGNPLPNQGIDQVAPVRGRRNEPGHPVAGAFDSRLEVLAVVRGEDPFDLEAGLDRQALLSQRHGQPPQQLAAAVLVGSPSCR